jgi:hypothetical protein
MKSRSQNKISQNLIKIFKASSGNTLTVGETNHLINKIKTFKR